MKLTLYSRGSQTVYCDAFGRREMQKNPASRGSQNPDPLETFVSPIEAECILLQPLRGSE